MKKYLAEFIGTFILTFTACGAVSFTGGYAGYLGVVGIAMIFGFLAAVIFYIFGEISGANCNPAVSAGMLIMRKITWIDFMGYVVSQILGGVAAGFALFGLSKSFDEQVISQYQSYGYDLISLGTNGYGDASPFLKINVWGAFVSEMFAAFIFVLAFICVTTKALYKNVAGIVIGMALAAAELFAVMLTGAGVNPARSFGPAFAKAVFGDAASLSQVWIFILAPLAGGIIAGLCYILFYGKCKKSSVKKEAEKSEEEKIEILELEEVTE